MLSITIVCSIIFAEIVLAYLIIKIHKKMTGCGKWLLMFMALCAYMTYLKPLQIYGTDASLGRVLLEVGRTLPFYNEFLGTLLPIKNGKFKLEHAFDTQFAQSQT